MSQVGGPEFPLRAGEQLVWSGAPRRGLLLQKTDAFWIPAGLLYTAFSSLWLTIAVVVGAGLPFVLYGSLFVVGGLYLLIGRFFVDAWMRARTEYALTDQRIVVQRRGREGWRTKQSMPLSQISLGDVSWRKRKDGSGTIVLGPELPLVGLTAGLYTLPGAFLATRFRLIENVEAVYLQLHGLNQATTRERPGIKHRARPIEQLPAVGNGKIDWHLFEDEELLWSGKPKRGWVLRPTDIYWIPVSFMFTGFSIFWLTGVTSIGAPLFFLVFGMAFVLIGLYLTIGRFYVDAWVRARTNYAVTDQRILVQSRHFRGDTRRVLPLVGLPGVIWHLHRDETGTISFGADFPMAGLNNGMHLPGAAKYLATKFEFITEVERVYRIILRAKHEAQTQG